MSARQFLHPGGRNPDIDDMGQTPNQPHWAKFGGERTMKKKLLLLLLAAGLVFGGQADADEITVLNNSFEEPDVVDGSSYFNINIPDWYYGGGTQSQWGLRNPVAGDFVDPVPDGNNVLFLGGFGTSMNQNLAETIQAGSTYTLTGYVSNFLSTQYASGILQLLTEDGDELAAAYTTSYSGNFLPLTATYVADSSHDGEKLLIRLLNWDPRYGFGIWDDIHLTKTTPEVVPLPGAVWLLGSGLLGLVGLRKLRKG